MLAPKIFQTHLQSSIVQRLLKIKSGQMYQHLNTPETQYFKTDWNTSKCINITAIIQLNFSP